MTDSHMAIDETMEPPIEELPVDHGSSPGHDSSGGHGTGSHGSSEQPLDHGGII